MVILASIVEKETALADERSRVAAVFINRLKLQHAPAVRPDGDLRHVRRRRRAGRLHAAAAADLNADALQHLRHPGLPPGPIANPGRASLEAVANPSRTRDLYFVADGTGGHAFAETYEEHLRNVARWRQIQQQQATPAPASAPADSAAPASDAAAPAASPG